MGEQSAVHRPGQSSTVNAAVYPGQPNATAKEYGVDMRGTTDTSGQVRDRANQDYDREHSGGFWDYLHRMVFKDGDINDQVHDETSRDAQTLSQDVSTRANPTIPGTCYMSFKHRQLQTMVKDNADATVSNDNGESWIAMGNEMVQFQTDFVGAIGASETNWRGKAGDSARKFMADIANYIGKAGQSAQLAGKQESLHSQALSSAGNSMPEPVDFDLAKANADLNNTQDPFKYMAKFVKYQGEYQASQAAHQQAADVVTTYDKSLNGASTMPAFDKPPQMADPGGPDKPIIKPVKKPKKTGGDDDGGDENGTDNLRGIDENNVDPGKDDHGTVIPPGGRPIGNEDRPTGVIPGDNGGIDKPGQDGTTLPGTGNPGGTDGQSFIPGGRGGGGGGGGGLNNPGGDNATAMPIGPMGGGGFGPVDDASRGGSRYGGGGGRSGFGAGATGGGRGGFGPGGGAGVGGLAAEQAALGRGGGMGGRGGSGAGGMGGMGGHKGEGGEDEEHQRASYLVEPDPDSTFGTDEMTAPPVIGG